MHCALLAVCDDPDGLLRFRSGVSEKAGFVDHEIQQAVRSDDIEPGPHPNPQNHLLPSGPGCTIRKTDASNRTVHQDQH